MGGHCRRQEAYDSGAVPGSVALVDCSCGACNIVHKQSAPYVEEPYRHRCIGCGEEWPCMAVRAGEGFDQLLAALKDLVENGWVPYDTESEKSLTYEQAEELAAEYPESVHWQCVACGGGGRSMEASTHGLSGPDGAEIPCPLKVARDVIAELLPRQ